jgi:DNA invertase Pin-like site-specific DNA recombinase
VYARYSTELQRASSIEDQIRVCRERIEREGWAYLHAYHDHAMSGTSRLRPAYQKLLDESRRGVFDIVVAEALDRLARDQEDVAHLYKRLSFLGIKIVTLSEGPISELHVGLSGTMGALYVKQLAEKTHRGLRGRVESGRSGGGNSYGYDVVRKAGANGEVELGLRSINQQEAEVVLGVHRAFAAGESLRSIAKTLNRKRKPGPSGGTWGPSTINGNPKRGTGILNNELYIGKMVWNRLKFDVVVSRFALMFFPDRVAALREMWRVLAPHSRLAVAVCTPIAGSKGCTAFAGILRREGQRRRGHGGGLLCARRCGGARSC